MNLKKARLLLEDYNDYESRKFWLTGQGKLHKFGGTGLDSHINDHSYHIQHIVAHPEEHGFKDIDHAFSERERVAKTLSNEHKTALVDKPNYSDNIEHFTNDKNDYVKSVASGRRDTDHHLEHAAMQNGSVRGYDTIDGDQREIRFDAGSDHHAINALKHLLPSVEESEKKGHSVYVRYNVFEQGKGAPIGHESHPSYNYIKLTKGQKPAQVFKTSAQIRQHIRNVQGGETSAKSQETKPETGTPLGFGASIGNTGAMVRMQKDLQAKGLPRFAAAAAAGFSEENRYTQYRREAIKTIVESLLKRQK
jgi:hypothetical protein